MFQGSLEMMRLVLMLTTTLLPTCSGASVADAGYNDLGRLETHFSPTPPMDTELGTMAHRNGAWRMLEESSQPNDDDESEHNRPLGASIAFVVITTLAVLAALYGWFFVYKFRNNPIVSVGQPPFLYLICFGSILLSSSTYFTAFDESVGRTATAMDKSCVAQKWFQYMGNIITYMSLFCKLWRVHKVTQFRRGQRILIQHVIAPLVVALVCAVGLLIAWTIQDPPNWSTQAPVDTFGDGWHDESVSICVEGSSIYFFATATLFFVAVGIALWMAWKTRHVREDISDSRRVCQALGAHVVLLILGFILSIVASVLQNATVYYASNFFLVIVGSLTTVSFLVVPKIYYVRYEEKVGHLPDNMCSVGGNVHITGVMILDSQTEGAAATMTAAARRTSFEAPSDACVDAENLLTVSPTMELVRSIEKPLDEENQSNKLRYK